MTGIDDELRGTFAEVERLEVERIELQGCGKVRSSLENVELMLAMSRT